MVHVYIRLLTGRFQVRILVAESLNSKIDAFQTYRVPSEARQSHQVFAG